MTQIVDGMGQIGTRVYPDVAHLPTPRLGAFAVVDGGAGGQLFVGLHDIGGVLSWIEWSSLIAAILTNPTPGHNVITDSNAGEAGLVINAVGDGLSAIAPLFPLQLSQNGATPTDPIIYAQRVNPTPATPLAQFNDGDGSNINLINGYAELAMRTYAALPAANTNHLGAIVRLLGGAGVEDTFWMCVLDATSTPVWTQFIGPTGATGATGPAGPPGTISYPALPNPGDAPVTFTFVVPGKGAILPWLLPVGYKVQVTSATGFWRTESLTAEWVTPATGTPVYQPNGINVGRLVGEQLTVASDDSITSSTIVEVQTVASTMAADGFLWLLMNADGTPEHLPKASGYMLATVKITPTPTTGTWTAFINFATSNVGFAPSFAGSGTRVGGTGWESGSYNNPDSCVGIDITYVPSAAFRCQGIEFVGNYTPPGTVPSAACRFLGEGLICSGTLNSHSETLNSGAYDRVAPYSPTDECSVTTSVDLFAFVDYGCAGGTPGGSMTLTGLTIKGVGPVPSELLPFLI